jgi:DNA polymerase-3 subunit gamma/tau
MSYQVLARKWRPRFFAEMVGQEHVLRALINALDDQRLHHAYLFTGTRGVGKTTIARILAKCLNCEQGVSSTPCGECSSCREIAEGRFVDLIEVDAASRTKVEDTRELLDNVQYAPTRGRYKVYLIDEVHMLSTHSFNALLKTLEEPPEHVKFLLATTDPQKLPITVLSRCLQFSLKNMIPERIVSYLERVLKAEEVNYEESALWQLGRAAQGSMRDALSLTDQAVAYGRGEVLECQVNDMLGTIDRGRVFKLAEILATGQVAELLIQVAAIAEHGPDYDEIVQALMQLWHKVAVAQVAPSSIDNAEGDKTAILELAGAMRAEDIQLFYQTALIGRKDLPLAADPRQGFEMILLRMLAFKPVNSAPLHLDLVSSLQAPNSSEPVVAEIGALATDSAASNIDSIEELSEEEKKPVADSEVATEPAASDMRQTFDEQETLVAPVFEESIKEERVVADSVLEQSAIGSVFPSDSSNKPLGNTGAADLLNNPLSSMASEAKAQLVAQVENVVTEAAFDFNWQQLTGLNWWQWVRHLPLAGMPMAIALNSALISRHENQLVMDVDPDQGALFNDAQRKRIEQVLCDITGLPVQLIMHVQLPRGETPHQRRTRLMAERFAQAEHAIIEDEYVQALVAEFEAHIIEGSIRPIVGLTS